VLGEGWPSLLPHGRIALQSFESYGPSIEIVTASGRQTAHFSNAFEFGSSPDGRRIAYSDSSHVVVGWTGKSTDRHSLGRGTHPSWSKQNWIAFLAEGSCGRTVERVFVVRPNGKHRHVLTRCPSPG
jgi:Tol biopolymer transport system component